MRAGTIAPAGLSLVSVPVQLLPPMSTSVVPAIQPLSLSIWLHQIGLSDADKVGVVHKMLGARYSSILMMEAPPSRRVVLPAGSTDAELAHATHRMGIAMLFAGVTQEAELLLLDAVERLRFEVGEEHKTTLGAKQTLGIMYAQDGRKFDAESLFRETLASYRRELGDRDPDTLGAINNLAELLKNTDRWDEAEALFHECLDAYHEVLGAEHPDTLGAMNNLAVLLKQEGRNEEVVPLQRQASSIYASVLGAAHPDTLGAKCNLATLLDDTGSKREARKVRNEVRRASQIGQRPGSLVSTTRSSFSISFRRKSMPASSVMTHTTAQESPNVARSMSFT